jgi:2'-5' RNA ligase
MRATFALLANREIHNLVRKLTWAAHRKYRTGTIDCRLPPHVSLKQPFQIEDLDAMEAYMGELAQSMPPLPVHLTELQLESIVFKGTKYGLLWIDVQETAALRRLHERLNQELSQRFGNTQADYDGAAYHFHMTVAMGGQSPEVYQTLLHEISDHRIDRQFMAQELAMFVYDEPLGPHGEYLTYKILPIAD